VRLTIEDSVVLEGGPGTARRSAVAGDLDEYVLELNRSAYELLGCEKQLEVIPGATHLFEELGALEQVAALATGWFETHLR